MKKARYWIVLIFMVLALVKVDSFVFAKDDGLWRPTLRGLQGVHVLVEEIRPEIERDGLTREELQRDTELKLRIAGIKVLSEREWLTTPGKPWLYLNVDVRKGKSLYSFGVSVQLNQNVYLVRDPNILAVAITWDVNGSGTTYELKDIRAATKDYVDKFINAYLSVNPK